VNNRPEPTDRDIFNAKQFFYWTKERDQPTQLAQLLAEERAKTQNECADKVKEMADAFDAQLVPDLDGLRRVGLCVQRNVLNEAEEAIRGMYTPQPTNTQFQEWNT
jgi:hypothetical protein